MTVSAVQSNNNTKRNVILTASGASIGAGIEALRTRKMLVEQKDSFISFVTGTKKGLEICRRSPTDMELYERVYESSKQDISKFKEQCKTNIKAIKKYAPLKILALGACGAFIGAIIGNFKKD